MKTVNGFPKKLAAAFVLVLAASSFLTACPGKGGGDGVPATVFTACANCASIASPTALVPSATSTSNSYWFPMTISWQILGDANLIAQANAMYTSPYYQPTTPWVQYRGQVIVRGGITLNNQVMANGGGYGGGYYPGMYPTPYGTINGAAGQCVIPAGSYTFDTVNAGMMQQGDFYVQDLEAVGPIRFRFQVRGQLVRSYGTTDQVHARIQVTSVNGISCGNITASVY